MNELRLESLLAWIRRNRSWLSLLKLSSLSQRNLALLLENPTLITNVLHYHGIDLRFIEQLSWLLLYWLLRVVLRRRLVEMMR